MDYRDYILNVVDGLPTDKLKQLPVNHVANRRAKALPDRVTHREGLPPVVDQGSIGSCVGHAVYYVLGASKPWFTKKVPSRLWAYKTGKKYDPFAGEDYSGTTVQGACAGLYKEGCCEEKYYPYIPDERVIPLMGADANAAQNKIKAYYSIPPTKEDLMKALVVAPLVSAFSVSDNFYLTDKEGKVLEEGYTTATFRGGHSVAMIGYNILNGELYLEFINSWGKNFGAGGRFFMSHSLFSAIGRDVFLLETSEDDLDVPFKKYGPVKSFFELVSNLFIKVFNSIISIFRK
jgi:hypothetical protein